MTTSDRQNNWSKGANNRARPNRLPEGFYRDSVNVNPSQDSSLRLRPGFRQVTAALDNVRGALALGDSILLADGADLRMYNAQNDTASTLASIVATGQFVGCEHNAELLFCTADECLRFDGATVRQWGVDTVVSQPAVTVGSGGLEAGQYAFAVTRVNAVGEEGGTFEAAFITVEEGESITISPPSLKAGETARYYMSAPNSTTLYFQNTTGLVDVLRTDTAPLDTQFFNTPSPGHLIASYKGVVLLAQDDTLVHTDPLRPHLRSPMRHFVRYPSRIKIIAPVDDGVFIVADKTYWLTGLGTDAPEQKVVNQVGAVEGSAVILPDNSVLWMTEYGQARGSNGGQFSFLTKDSYLPRTASEGNSGVVEQDGDSFAVTVMRGVPEGNPLAASDFIDAEIVYP